MEFTVSGEHCNFFTNFLEEIFFNASKNCEIVVLDFGPLLSHPVFLCNFKGFTLQVCLFHLFAAIYLEFFKRFLWNALLKKLLAVDFSHGLVLLNDFVHHGLSESGLIKLIVTEFTVSN